MSSKQQVAQTLLSVSQLPTVPMSNETRLTHRTCAPPFELD
jgi:hypothetical protein